MYPLYHDSSKGTWTQPTATPMPLTVWSRPQHWWCVSNVSSHPPSQSSVKENSWAAGRGSPPGYCSATGLLSTIPMGSSYFMSFFMAAPHSIFLLLLFSPAYLFWQFYFLEGLSQQGCRWWFHPPQITFLFFHFTNPRMLPVSPALLRCRTYS